VPSRYTERVNPLEVVGDATGSAASAATPHRAPKANSPNTIAPTKVTVAKPPSVSVGKVGVLRCHRIAMINLDEKATVAIAVIS
jgi:hypothetical protein